MSKMQLTAFYSCCEFQIFMEIATVEQILSLLWILKMVGF